MGLISRLNIARDTKMKLKNSYAWYKLGEADRHEIYLKGETFQTEDNQCGVYLPVLWDNPYINYNQPYGLLSFPKIFGGYYDSPKYKGKRWFKVGVSSPDDWDLDFQVDLSQGATNEEAERQYNDLIEIAKSNVITGPVDPKELFFEIQKEFCAKYPNVKTHLC